MPPRTPANNPISYKCEHIQNKYLLPLKVCIAEVTGTEYQIKFIPRDLPREQQRRYLEKTAPVKEKTHKHKEVSPIAEKANRTSVSAVYVDYRHIYLRCGSIWNRPGA